MEPVTYTEEELYGLTMIFKLTRNCLVNEDLLDSTKTTWRLDKDSTLERRFRRLSRNLTELAQSERYSWNDTHIAVAARRIVDPRTSCGDASTLVDDLNEEIEKIIASLR
jgi:hypothetical protein